MEEVGAEVGTDGVQFHLEEFEGPLDLLLHLIQRAELNIYDIPIATITQQYLAYLRRARQRDDRLEDLTQFYVMAATLLHIKSRMLLPRSYDPDDEFADPRRDLVERLLEYQRYRRLSELLDEEGERSRWIVVRSERRSLALLADDSGDPVRPDVAGNGAPSAPSALHEVQELLASFRRIVSSLGGGPIADLYEEHTIKEKVALLYERLESEDRLLLTDLVRGKSAMELVCALSAVLELAKAQAVRVVQERSFAPIGIRRRDGDA